MNRIYPTPKGFVLITTEDLPPHQVAHMVEQLNDATGMQWVIIPRTVESVEAKTILAGKKFEEVYEKMKASAKEASHMSIYKSPK